MSTEAAQELYDNGIGETKEFPKAAKITLVVVGALFAIAIGIYLGVASYYKDHFYANTIINGKNYAGYTVEEVEAELAVEVRGYSISLTGREDMSQHIAADDISYHFVSTGEVQQILENQSIYRWIHAFFQEEKYDVALEADFAESDLMTVFGELVFLEEDKVTAPQNAYLEYRDGSYQMIEEIDGNLVDEYVLYDYLQQAIMGGETEISLEDVQCYVEPEYTKESPELLALQEKLNQFVQTNIEYEFGERSEVLNGDSIQEWLSFNDDFEVSFQEEKVGEYVNWLADQYDTYNMPRTLVTNDGSEVLVNATAYGWKINREAETTQLLEDIYSGRQVKRDPIFEHTAVSHYNSDLGNTYVEIDLSNQRLWFYKDGVEIVSTSIVSGNIAKGHTTPEGTYTLKYKQRDTVLRGQDYASPVKYWMPFNGGIGLHDASWRYNFGGSIFRTSGSHGCINMPTDMARQVFEQIESGTPIICYYRSS